MTKEEKQTRLDQFETREAFGVWPQYQLIRKARRASVALFRFDTLCAGGIWRDKAHRVELGLHIEWKHPDGTPAEFRDGEPHLMREYLAPDPARPGMLYGGNYHDCGKVRNADKIARAAVVALSDWFKANGAPNVRATFGGDLRYIKITDGKRDYSLID